LDIAVNGEKYHVEILYPSNGVSKSAELPAASGSNGQSSPGGEEIIAPIEGNFMLTKEASETAVKVGDMVKEGDLIGYIESMKVYNAIMADKSGKVSKICVPNGEKVFEDDPLIELS
jgi:pyruvate carboxylase subunit B